MTPKFKIKRQMRRGREELVAVPNHVASALEAAMRDVWGDGANILGQFWSIEYYQDMDLMKAHWSATSMGEMWVYYVGSGEVKDLTSRYDRV